MLTLILKLQDLVMECFKYLEIVTVFGLCIFQLVMNININLGRPKFLKLGKAKITIQEGIRLCLAYN